MRGKVVSLKDGVALIEISGPCVEAYFTRDCQKSVV